MSRMILSAAFLFGLLCVAAPQIQGAPARGDLEKAGALFYSSFDKGAEPEYAREAQPYYEYLVRKPQAVAGKVGGAMSFGRLTYRMEGSLDGDRGTLALWFKGKLDKSEQICVVYSREWGFYHRHVRWEGTGAVHSVRYYDLWGHHLGGVSAKVQDPEQWHHLAFTWDRTQGIAFYLDGRKTGERKTSWWASLRASAVEMYAGPQAAYDEMYAFDRALTPAEIKGLAAGKLPSPAPNKPLTEAQRKTLLKASGLDDPANQFIEVGEEPILVEQIAIDKAKSGTITMPWLHDGRYHPFWPDVYTGQQVLDVWPKPEKINYVTWEASHGKTRLETADGLLVAADEGNSPNWTVCSDAFCAGNRTIFMPT